MKLRVEEGSGKVKGMGQVFICLVLVRCGLGSAMALGKFFSGISSPLVRSKLPCSHEDGREQSLSSCSSYPFRFCLRAQAGAGREDWSMAKNFQKIIYYLKYTFAHVRAQSQ